MDLESTDVTEDGEQAEGGGLGMDSKEERSHGEAPEGAFEWSDGASWEGEGEGLEDVEEGSGFVGVSAE